jgi:hypothetical protein
MADSDLEVLAVFVHGSLAALHVLGVVYNARRGNRGDVAIHAAAAGYDLWATWKHARKVRNGPTALRDTKPAR